MTKSLNTAAKLLMVTLTIGLVSACSTIGATGSPQQIAQARAVHAFDENRAPFGQRFVAAQAVYRPGVRGLNPFFGR